MAETGELPQPHAALKRLEPLVGTWELRGRTLDAQEDNIFGRTVISWLPGGFFLEQRSTFDFVGEQAHSLEILGYDPATDTFPAWVFSSMGETALRYEWDVQGDVVTHWTKGSKYTGTLSPDGKTLTGGWRPVEGVASTDGNAYDATMIRVA